MLAPDCRLYQEQWRHGNGFTVEDSRYYLAAAPFNLLLVVGHALPGRQHIIYDNDFFPFYIPRDPVIPFEDALLVTFGFVQAFARLEHIHIVQSRCQFRAMGTDIPVKPFEASEILYIHTARHEHDMIGFAVRLQGGHARLEKFDAVYVPPL